MAAQGVTTVEVSLIGPITFIAVAAHRAGARCVARVNKHHAHARELRLVADKRSELPKCPGMVHPSLLPSNRYSLANLCQILQSDCLTGRVRLTDQRLADAVIGVLLKAVLTSCVLAQSPSGSAGVCQLQTTAMVVSPLPNRLNLLPAKSLAIRVSGEIDDTQINAQVADWLIRSGSNLRLRDAQIPYIAAPHQFRAADLPRRIVQVAALEITQDKVTNNATRQRVEIDPIQTHQAIGAGIVAERAIGCECRAGLGDNLISQFVTPLWGRTNGTNSFCRLITGAAGQLCAQAGPYATLGIDQVVQLVLVGDVLIPGDGGAVVCRCVKRKLGLTQGGISRGVSGEFTADGSCGDRYAHRRSQRLRSLVMFIRIAQ